MSRPTGQTLSRWWLPGILYSLSEKGSPSPAGICFSFPPGIFIPTGQTLTAVASAPETASHQTMGPAIDNAIRRRALRISLALQHDAISSLPQKATAAEPEFPRPCKQL